MQRVSSLFLIVISLFGLFLQPGAVQAQSNLLSYSPAALVVWTDKYVYTPGENLTLRWTVRANGDTAGYAVVIYRQNNQTGVKTYFPGNSTSTTDIAGRTPEQGMTVFYLGADANKAIVIGAGGWLSPSYTVPNELGMHTFVVQLRDATGTRIVKSSYFKFGIVSGFENITGNIESSRTLVNTVGYRLSGIVAVRNNAVLTIQPGTFILGEPGSQPPSVLVVSQNGRIDASGTRARPIIMTSSQPFGNRRAGDWGGLVLLGRAPVNLDGGTGFIEGLTANEDLRYGGTDPNHNCGTLRYVRVEYAGAEFQPNSEINAITWGGCGKATVADHLQTKYGLDDAFEWFGGTTDAKYLVGVSMRDDYIDGQLGWTGRVQFGVMVAGKDVPGNRGIEMDNSEFNFTASPLTSPQMYNITFIGAGDTLTAGFDEGVDVAGVWLRRGAGGSYNNMLLYNWISNGFTMRDAATAASATRGDLSVDGILMFDNGKAANKTNDVPGQVSGGASNLAFPLRAGTGGRAANVGTGDPALRRPLFISDPDFRARGAGGSLVNWARWIQPPDDGFFDQSAAYMGAFGDVDWTEEWTSFHVEEDVRP